MVTVKSEELQKNVVMSEDKEGESLSLKWMVGGQDKEYK